MRVLLESGVFLHRPGIPFEGQRDVLRFGVTRGLMYAALSNAFDCGFSTCWPEGSRLLLDRVEQHLEKVASAPLDEVVRTAFATAATQLVDGGGRDFEDSAATLCLAVWRRGQVVVGWIGGEHVCLLRDGTVVEANEPHTMGQRARVEGADEESPWQHLPPTMLTRVMHRDDHVPELRTWSVSPGDQLCMQSSYLAEGRVAQDCTLADLEEGDAAYVARLCLRFQGTHS